MVDYIFRVEKLKYRIGVLVACFLMFSHLQSLAQNSETLYWYQDGRKEVWHIQDDVMAYRSQQGKAIVPQLNSNALLYYFFRDSFSDKMNIIYFQALADKIDKENVIANIINHSDFQIDFPIITLSPDSSAEAGKWLLTDDMIMVRFRNENISQQVLNDFRTKYALQLKNPEIAAISSSRPTYIFAFSIPFSNVKNSIELAKKIYENDSLLVENVLPNRIVAYRPIEEKDDIITFTRNYFNPNNQQFYIHLSNQNILKVYFANEENTQQKKWFKIYDTTGQLVLNRLIDNYAQQEIYLKIENMAAGTYYTFIESNGGKIWHHQKFMKPN